MQVTMTIVENELRWFSPITGKKYLIDLPAVKYVESGKKTHNFNKKASLDAQDDLCLSLVCQSTTVDLETLSAEDRNTLVDNFHLLIERYILDKKGSDTGSNAV